MEKSNTQEQQSAAVANTKYTMVAIFHEDYFIRTMTFFYNMKPQHDMIANSSSVITIDELERERESFESFLDKKNFAG
jgi:hypothetical protein